MPYCIVDYKGKVIAANFPDRTSAKIHCARYVPGGYVMTHGGGI
jgi:hypothetical protein